jgi:hypothetical protein
MAVIEPTLAPAQERIAEASPEQPPAVEPVEEAPTPTTEEPAAVAAPVESKPDPELSPEQIESDLGVGVVPPEIEIAIPHGEPVTEAIATAHDDSDASAGEASPSAASTDHDYRRVAAGGE